MALLRRGPIDEWTLREKLTLAGAVLRIGDNNWSAVSKAVKPLGEDLRPMEWFSPKNCALQYSELLDKADVHKRKRGEKSGEDPPERVIVRRLAQERIEELSRIINKEREQYRNLKMDVENIRAGIYDPKLADIWEQMVKEKEAQKKAEEEAQLRQSATAVVASVSSATTPRVTKKLARPQARDLTLSVGPDGDAGALREAQTKTEPTDGEETPPAAFLLSDADTDPGDETARASMALPALPFVEEAKPEVVQMEGPDVEVVLDGEVATPVVEDVKQELVPEPVETIIEEQVIEETLKLEEPMDVVATEVEIEEKPSTIPTPAIEEEKPAPISTSPSTEINPKVEPTTTTVAEATPETAELVPEPSETLSVGGEVTPGMSAEVPPSPASSVGSRLSEAPTPSQTSRSGRRAGRKSKGRKATRQSIRTRAESETSVGGEEKLASEAEDGAGEQMPPLPSTPLLGPESTPASPASFTHSDTEDERAYKAWKKSIIMVWRAAANHKYANVFMAPVTDEIAPGYNSVIKRPLDLVTIKKNIETGQLRSTTVFQRDIMLMFSNALMYNSEDHHVHEMAREMYDDVMQHIQQFVSTQLMVTSTAESKSLRATRRADTDTRASSVDRDDDRKRQSESETLGDSASKPKKRKV